MTSLRLHRGKTYTIARQPERKFGAVSFSNRDMTFSLASIESSSRLGPLDINDYARNRERPLAFVQIFDADYPNVRIEETGGVGH